VLIRDPIHGDISLNPTESIVLDFPEVQRLRGIRQLGTASYVYPGAVHTRFDHSLGVNACAGRILNTLRRQGFPIEESLATQVGVVALLHDITHLPFGHTLEDERRLFPRHDKGERWHRFLDGRLGNELAALGLRDEVADLLGPSLPAELPAWSQQIVSSTIDADLLDYLRRDSYFTGLAQRYDDRIFRYFTIAGDQLALNMTKHGMERSDASSEIVQVLRMRYFLTERVYYHHTKVAAGAMISKAIELAHGYGRLGEAELQGLNEGQLLERLRNIPNAERPDSHIREFIDRLETRALFKRGYVVSAHTIAPHTRRDLVTHYHESPAHRHEAEQELARQIGCDPAEVIVYCPALTTMKEAAALVQTPQGVVRLNEIDHSGEIRALQARYEHLWRFYVFVPEAYVEKTAAAAAEMFGAPSEHRRVPGSAGV